MKQIYNVLFLCHDNAGRSLMAEAMLNKLGHGRFLAYSAGSHPAKEAHPIALEVLKHEKFEIDTLQPKHLKTFHTNKALQMDLVITLCKNSQEDMEFQSWYGEPVTAHWHFDDPHELSIEDNQNHDIEYHHYEMVQRDLARRLTFLLNLPDVQIDKMALRHSVIEL